MKTYFRTAGDAMYAKALTMPKVTAFAEKVPIDGTTVSLESLTLDAAKHEFAKIHVNKNTRWIFCVEGENESEKLLVNIGDLIEKTMFFYDEQKDCVFEKVFNYIPKRKDNYFDTPQEAIKAGRQKRKAYLAAYDEAQEILKKIENNMCAMPCTFATRDGYVCATIKHKEYKFKRHIELNYYN